MPSWFPENNTPKPQDTVERSLQKINDLILTGGGGGAGAPTDATYITQTPNATLTNEQALSTLATGLLKNTTGTGVLSIAAGGTDFVAPSTTLTIAGTANQIISSAGAQDLSANRTWTLSTPQDIATTSTPQFARLGLGAAADANHTLLIRGGTITTDKKLIDGAVTWNDAGVTFTAIEISVTNTASAAASLLVDIDVGGTTQWKLSKAGVVTQTGALLLPDGTAGAPALSFASDTNTGIYLNSGLSAFVEGGSVQMQVGSARVTINQLGFPASSADTFINREAANIIGQRNATNAQTWQLYETFTNSTNYSRVAIAASSSGHSIASQAAGTGTLRKLILDPGTSDIQWNKALVALGGGSAATLGTIGGSGPATAAQNSWLQLLDSTGVTCWVPVWK